MIKGWEEQYNNKPIITTGMDYYKIKFFYKKTTPQDENKKSSENEELKHLLKHPLKELYDLIKQNSGINREQLSKLTSSSVNTLKDQIKKLVDKNLIERRGSGKTGEYFVKKENK
jgi:predicted HTH transcriptional regulator